MRKPRKCDLAEFLVEGDSGPLSLFRRIRQVMAAPRRLAVRKEKLVSFARTWPSTSEELEAVLDFDSAEWTLNSAMVRQDTGKFVQSTWRKKIGEKFYFVTIGYGDSVERIWWQHDCPETPDPSDWIAAGNMNRPLVDAVERVNAELLARNAPFSPPKHPLPRKEERATKETGGGELQQEQQGTNAAGQSEGAES